MEIHPPEAEPERRGCAENRRPGKAEGRATEGWPEGCSIGDDANQRLPQAGPQGFAGRENSEQNLAEGASGLVTRHQSTPEPSLREGDAWPDAGSITMRGRVGALIALWLGFIHF